MTLASRAFPQQVAAVSSLMIGALMAGVGLGSFVIGGLRELLPLETLYRLSMAYPAAALGLGVAAVACGACRQPVRRLWLGLRAE